MEAAGVRAGKMWRLVLTVVLWNNISSQPVTDEAQAGREVRQVDYIECCPCPGSSHVGLQGLPPTAPTDGLLRAAAVDDCPCRVRDADTQGSPSVFLPRAVRPVRPFLTPEESKEDVKPLLQPEVGLASSMLETLREVTDEEYQEALARDAARNAARVADLAEAQPETADNVLTIIVNPIEDDVKDAAPEASQPVETRCAPPAANLGEVREAEKTPVFKLSHSSLGRNSLDMDSGASNVQQNVASLNKSLQGLRLKTTPSVLKLFPTRKSGSGNIQSLLKLKDNKMPKNAESLNKLQDSFQLKLPLLNLHTLFRKNEDSSSVWPLSLDDKKLNISKMRTSLVRQPKVSENHDNKPSPSIIREQLAPHKENRNSPLLNLKSILPKSDILQPSLNLKSLLNLEDVEIISPKSTSINLPKLNLFPSLRINNQKHRKSERLTKNCDNVDKEDFEQSKERKSQVHTTILDVVPHSSNSSPVLSVNDISSENFAKDNTNIVQGNSNLETDVFDTLPGASDNNEIIVNVPETLAPSLEDGTPFESNLGPQQIEEDIIEPLSMISKDNIENVDFNNNNVKITIDDDENGQLGEFEIVQESNQPFDQIEISGNPLVSRSHGLDLEIDQFSTDGVLPTFNLITENNEPIFIEEEKQTLKDFEFESGASTQDFEEFNIESVPETGRSDVIFMQPSLGKDATVAESNQNIQTASIEFTEGKYALPNDGFLGKSSSLSVEQDSDSVSITDFLSSLKERIASKLDNLKKTDKNTTSSQKNGLDTEERPIEKSSLNSDEFVDVEPLTEDTKKDLINEKAAETVTKMFNEVTMHDLQQMSDSLLEQSEMETHVSGSLEEQSTAADDINEKLQPKNETSLSEESNNEENEDTDFIMDSSVSPGAENFDDIIVDDSKDFGKNSKSPIEFKVKKKENFDDKALSSNPNNLCPSNLLPVNSLSNENMKKSVTKPTADEPEMASAASETVFETSPHFTSLRNPSPPILQQSIVVQPSSLFPPIAPLDIQTLDDIRTGISNLLGGNARASDDEEVESDDDCFDTDSTMFTDASTKNENSAFPSLNPLEDINLDIFQLNPQTQGSSLLSKIPSLNLNSFKTKLALPKSAHLKPMTLQSALGRKDGGLLGATLTFGSDKSVSESKTSHIIDLDSIFNRHGLNRLGSPITKLPSLEELRSTMRANTKSLLKSPLVSPLSDTLRTTEALGDSLRTHTENTMKNIQKTLSSTLNEARVGSTAGPKFAKPQDLVEMVSSAHEDMKDKLYGIHVDLQDRLDSILDKSKIQIPSLQSPLLSTLGRFQENTPSRPTARNSLKKTPSPKLIVNKKRPTPRVSKPKELNKVQPFKFSKAASSLIPKTVEVPKLMATSSKTPFLQPLQRDHSLKLKERNPILSMDQEKNTINNKLKPFGIQTKVTIATTPRPSSFEGKSTGRRKFDENSAKKRNERLKSMQKERKFGSFRDSSSFASEPQITKVPANAKSISVISKPTSLESEGKQITLQGKTLSSSGSLPDFLLTNPLKSKTSIPSLRSKLGLQKSTLKPVALPKPTESPFVSKMREAIRIRFSRPALPSEKMKSGNLGKSHAEDDMTKSASENKSVVVKKEPMKENIPYKCKMVCVREG